jgi:hypothetical protein
MRVPRKTSLLRMVKEGARSKVPLPAQPIGGAEGPAGPEGPKGATGGVGPEGPLGPGMGVNYLFNKDTAFSGPGVGKLKFVSSNTGLRIAEVDDDGANVTAWIETFDDSSSVVQGFLILHSRANLGTYRVYSCTGLVFDLGEYWSMAVVEVAGAGTWAENEPLTAFFVRTGDKGETGEKGAKGETGAQGPEGAGTTMAGFKEPCRVATTANVTTATALNAADVIDGVSLVNGDRVLVMNQTTKSQNGIYVVGVSPARATDADALGDLLAGTQVMVTEGTLHADRAFKLTTDGAITPGTTGQVWVPLVKKWTTGTVELEWNGAGEASNTKEVGHGLGVAPTAIKIELATLITVAGNSNLFGFGTEATSSTVFKVNATLPTGSKPAAGTKVKFFWAAFE